MAGGNLSDWEQADRQGHLSDFALLDDPSTSDTKLRRLKRTARLLRDLLTQKATLSDQASRTNSLVPPPSQFHSGISIPDYNKETRLRKYSPSLTKSLYEVFHSKKYLPCRCPHREQKHGLYEDHFCALRLHEKWEVPGDRTHSFFSLAVARGHEFDSKWVRFQLELPNGEKQVSFDGDTSSTHDQSPKPTKTNEHHELLEDVCEYFNSSWDFPDCEAPIRIEREGSRVVAFMLTPVLPDTYLEKAAPVPLRELLESDCLSAKSKISLAFTLAKSIWQYYDSDLMKMKWDTETIKILKRTKLAIPSLQHEHRMPFLEITSSTSTAVWSEDETQVTEKSNKPNELHPYPFILTLGMLLVQICLRATPERSAVPPCSTGNNTIYLYYKKKMEVAATSWPVLDLRDEYRNTYRQIVAHCIPSRVGTSPLFASELDAIGRRNMLMKHVVGPLHNLLSYASDPTSEVANEIASSRQDLGTVSSSITASQSPHSEKAREWMKCLKMSPLRGHVSRSLSTLGPTSRRPRIAIIDTGYDPNSRCLSGQLKRRMTNHPPNHPLYHWKDFWKAEKLPCDDDGHGTSMLSLIAETAPFADIFVARIAGEGKHMSEKQSETGENLAEAIKWAAEVHEADIISMSLGWEEEPRLSNGRRPISNAIARVLGQRNEEILFFAAASNDGGRTHDFFPARHAQVFSIRATNTDGYHEGPNAALPESHEMVFGTLGINVPTARTGRTTQEIVRDGASPATAIAAGLAALIIGYITIDGRHATPSTIQTHHGFKQLLCKTTKYTDPLKRFFTLEEFYEESRWKRLDAHLSIASRG